MYIFLNKYGLVIYFLKNLKHIKKKYMKDFFDEDGYIQNLKIEELSRSWNGVKNTRRLDFELDIGNDRKIVIEYLEDHHTNELKDWNLYQSIRLVYILFCDKKDQIVHFAFVWDKLMTDAYIKQKVKYIVNKIKDFHDIDNEKEYTISILNEEIKNKKLSNILVDVFINENKPILDLNKLDNIFSINKEKKDDLVKRFIKMADLMSLNINKKTSDIFDSDSEDDIENDTEGKICFYKQINNGSINTILLTNNGLFLYLDSITMKDLNENNKYIFKIRFVNLIGKSAYESAKRIRNIILKQKENIISGLDEI